MEISRSADVAVVGGGAIGAACAYELSRHGAKVVLLEREKAVGGGASAGTACLVTPSHAERLANARALRQGLASVVRHDSAFTLRPRGLPLAWLTRFALSCLRSTDSAAGTRLLRSLAQESLVLHRSWNDLLDLGLEEMGILNVWRRRGGVNGRNAFVEEQTASGFVAETVSPQAFAHLEPALIGVVAAALCPEEAHVESAVFVRRLAEHASALGAKVDTGTEVIGLRVSARHVELKTSAGTILCDQVVLANGLEASRFFAEVGVPIPLVGAKGYHVEFAMTPPLTRPLFLVDDHVVATPLSGRLRLAGTLELGTDQRDVDQQRAATLVRAASAVGLTLKGTRTVWCGSRPVAADGMPMIGKSPRFSRIVIAAGHGMLGLTLAPITAQHVATIISGEELPELSLLDPGRFSTRIQL
jgi:D-amino-acid dehydrogenase